MDNNQNTTYTFSQQFADGAPKGTDLIAIEVGRVTKFLDPLFAATKDLADWYYLRSEQKLASDGGYGTELANAHGYTEARWVNDYLREIADEKKAILHYNPNALLKDANDRGSHWRSQERLLLRPATKRNGVQPGQILDFLVLHSNGLFPYWLDQEGNYQFDDPWQRTVHAWSGPPVAEAFARWGNHQFPGWMPLDYYRGFMPELAALTLDRWRRGRTEADILYGTPTQHRWADGAPLDFRAWL